MAGEFAIPHAYNSYAELCEDPELDAVYIALPVSLHAEYCEMALRAGKHVLCEKPFALDATEAEQVLSTAHACQRLVMEAHHWRYHPLLSQVARLIGQVGELTFMSASFQAGINREGDIRRNTVLGAGVTLDFGCYAVQWIEWAAAQANSSSLESPLRDAGGKKLSVTRCLMTEGEPGVDEVVRAHLTVDGTSANIFCDMRPSTPFGAQLTVEGERGLVHFENPLHIDETWAEFEPTLAGQAVGLKPERVELPAEAPTTYAAQLDAFVRALRSGQAPPTSGSSIVGTQRALDELYQVAGLPNRRAFSHASREVAP
jgi:predicted dehydrogenase